MVVDDRDREDLLTELLVQIDEQLAAGTASGYVDASSIAEDEEILAKWEADRHCLELLHRVRRGWSPDLATTDTPRPTHAAVATPTGKAGTTLGRFHIQSELGHGGLGVVYLAYDPKLHRQVALKVPRLESLVSDDLRRRFLREAEAAARLSHPHLVSVYEAGEEASICYIAAEFCPGPTLAEWLKSRKEPVPIDTAARVVKQLAEAVQHAHGRGVLHRDIKPSNVMLTRPQAESQPTQLATTTDENKPIAGSVDGDAAFPKLTDFGMAKLLEREGDETRSGALVGTPAYMAPEQAQGRVRDVDARADVYALGAMLYEILTGRRVFESASDIEALRHVLFDDPVAPRRIRHDIPRDLEAICLKCLAKERDARYVTAQDLSDDLGRFLAGQVTEARPLVAAERAWKWARRRPAIAALWTVVVVAAATLFGVVVAYSARLSSEVTRADRAREVAQREAEASRRLLYAADVGLAQGAYQADNVPQMLEYLQRHIPKNGQEDLRSFAWHYLQGLSHQEALSLEGHDDEVFCVVYSADGRRLATASKDGTARIWNAVSGNALHVLRGHTDEVMRVAFSPDGRLLASSSEDCTIRLWNTDTGAQVGVLEGHSAGIPAIAFSPDGKLLASGSWDSTVRVWNVARRLPERVLESPADFVQAVSFSPDGSLLVSGDDAGAVHCWRVSDWQELPGAKSPGFHVLAVAFSHDFPWLAYAGKSDWIEVRDWDVKGLSGKHRFRHDHLEKIQCLAFSPFDNRLVSCDKAGIVKLWSLGRQGPPERLLGHIGRVWSVAWSPDGRTLATAGADRVVRLWDSARRPAGSQLPLGVAALFRAMTVNSQGNSATTFSKDGFVRTWDLTAGRLIGIVRAPIDSVEEVGLAPDGMHAAVASKQELAIWNYATGKVLLRQANPWACQGELVWSSDSQHVALRIDEGHVAIIDRQVGRVTRLVKVGSAPLRMTFSPDGQRLAIRTDQVRLHDVRTGELKHSLGDAFDATFSSDGKSIACCKLGETTLWDVATGKVVRSLVPQQTELYTLKFSSRGRILATAPQFSQSNSVLITLFDVQNGQPLLQLECEDCCEIIDFTFTGNDDQLLALGQDSQGMGRIWRWSLPRDASRSTVLKDIADTAWAPLLAAEERIPLQRQSDLLIKFEMAADAIGTCDPIRVRCVPPAPISAFDQDGPTGSVVSSPLPSSAILHPIPAFGASRTIASGTREPRRLAVADFDGDGDLDVAAMSRSEGRLHMLTNDGSGTEFHDRAATVDRCSNILAADLNGSGLPGVVCSADSQAWWLTFDSSGAPQERRTLSKLRDVDGMAAADLDGDGDLDLVCGAVANASIVVLENLGAGRLGDPQSIGRFTGGDICLTTADLDADGDIDILSGSSGDDTVAWYANQGHGRFSVPRVVTTHASRVMAVVAADLDGDTDPDVLYAGDESAVWFANDGKGSFTLANTVATKLVRATDVDVVDLDVDGDLDVLLCDHEGDRVTCFVNDGRGRFNQTVHPVDGHAPGCECVEAFDVNGDGRPDAIIAARDKNAVIWRANEGLRFDVELEQKTKTGWQQLWRSSSVLPIMRSFTAGRRHGDRLVDSVTLRFEDLEGRPLSAAEVNARVNEIAIYRDENCDAAIDPQVDQLVATASALTVRNGAITVPLLPDHARQQDQLSDASSRNRQGSPTTCQLIRAVNDWATVHGYAGGYPTFVRVQRDSQRHYQAVVFKAASAKLVEIPSTLLASPIGTPRSDYDLEQHLFADVAGRICRWARVRGYGGAIFGARVADGGSAGLAYQALLLKVPDMPQISWNFEDLDQPESLEQLFRNVHNRARQEGHLSGFPTFAQNFDCVMVSSTAGELVEIPADELR